MKRAILCAVLLAFLFCSCKKEHSAGTNPAQKTYKVNLTLSGFSATILGSAPGKQTLSKAKALADVPLGSLIKRLYYAVYDASGNLVHTIYKDSTYLDLGSVNDSLASGTYTVLVGGGQGNFGSNFATSTLATAAVSFGLPCRDAFFAKTTLTVAGSNVSQTINMNRIVGKLTFKILDAIPANASSIVININGEYGNYSAASLSPFDGLSNTQATYNIPASAIGQPNYTQTIDILNTIQPFSVTISCYDASRSIIAQAIISNVTVAVDSQTVLAGSLFNSGGGGGIYPGLNLGVGTPIVVQF